MARARAKKKRYEANMRIVGIGFNVVTPSRTDGEICGANSRDPLEYTKLVGEGRAKKEVSIQVRGLKLLSCWMDAVTGDCIKAHALLLHNNEQHATLLNDLDEAKLAPCPKGFELTTDPAGIRYGSGGRTGMASIVRYATKQGHVYQESDRVTFDKYYVYETKAKAILEMLAIIKKHRTIGGITAVSWNRVPDSLMLELGFEKIDDMILDSKGRPRGVPMWKGVANSAFMASGFGGPSVDSVKQLLDLLSRSLNKAS